MSPEQRAEMLRQAPLDSWIALSADEKKIVASGTTFCEAVENAKKVGEHEPVLIRTPEEWTPIVV